MKKVLKIALLLCALTLLLCIGVLADEPTEPDVAGIYDVTPVEGVTITPQTANKGEVTPVDTYTSYPKFCADAVRMKIDVSEATNGAFYLLIVTNKDLGSEMPTAGDIVYIDQVTADDGTASFNAYPSSLGKGAYYIYLSSSAGTGLGSGKLTKIGSFESYVPYTLGDVDNNTKIESVDALAVLQHVAKISTLEGSNALAADVDKNGKIESVDALGILQYVAKIITEF